MPWPINNATLHSPRDLVQWLGVSSFLLDSTFCASSVVLNTFDEWTTDLLHSLLAMAMIFRRVLKMFGTSPGIFWLAAETPCPPQLSK